MPIQETFDYPGNDFCYYFSARCNPGKLKDSTAMSWMDELASGMSCHKRSGITYADGSWGYTVLRTVYSDESDALWPVAIDKLKRWVTQYFVHLHRLASDKPDMLVNEEVARRFILEVLDDEDTVSEIQKLNLPQDLAEASQEDVDSLIHLFDNWVKTSIGDQRFRVYPDDDDNIDFFREDNPRFSDFLIIDEPALRSLAALPDKTPPLHLVTWERRQARIDLYGGAYVWLVDSLAARRFDGVEHAPVEEDVAGMTGWKICYRGWLKLKASNITDAWFERLKQREKDEWQFCLDRMPQGLGDWWYHQPV